MLPKSRLAVIGLGVLFVIAAAWVLRPLSGPAAQSAGKTIATADAAPAVKAPISQAPEPAFAPATTPLAREVPAAAAPVAQVFGEHGPVTLADIPAGSFRRALLRLPGGIQAQALEQLGRLRVPVNNLASLRVDRDGRLFYFCAPPNATQQAALARKALAAAAPKVPQAAAVPVSAPPVRHSRPGASKVIYLDFNGHTITGTHWNEGYGEPGDEDYEAPVATYEALAYDTDSNPATFSDAEQAAIVQIWARVAEDYLPFDVDVTTEEPANFTLNTGRIVVTKSKDSNNVDMPSSSAGGVAYVDVFGYDNYAQYSPAFVYYESLASDTPTIADAASHEMGHNLGLEHDGTTTEEYYDGHGSGPTSWGPIMGAPYGRAMSQWSKGEYYQANNTQDDLAILAGRLSYRYAGEPDDRANDFSAATPLTVNGSTLSGTGLIDRPGDYDSFSFTTTGGSVTFTITPNRPGTQTIGSNLHVAFEVAGSLMGSGYMQPEATFSTSLAAGVHYLRVYASASGNPWDSNPTGYTGYGSLGEYTIVATPAGGALPQPTVGPASVTVAAGQAANFTAQFLGATSLRWQRHPVGGEWTDLYDDAVYSGCTTTTLTVAGTHAGMDGDEFRLVASNQYGSIPSIRVQLTVTGGGGVPPTFTSRPLSQLATVGQAVTFTAAVNGAETISWRHNGQAIAGASGLSHTIPSAVVADAGYYEVVATSAGGTATSCFYLAVAPTGQAAQGWGYNDDKQSESPVAGYELAAVDGGVTHSVGLLRNGTVIQWGGADWVQQPPVGLANVVAISVFSNTNLALKSDGTVVAWGQNSNGQLTVPAGLSDVVAISASWSHCLALKANGTVVAWGSNSWGESTIPGTLSGVVGIAAGSEFSLALKADGTVVSWGGNFNNGSQTPPPGLSGVVAISAGYSHALALKADGTVVGWGNNYSGQATVPADAMPARAIAAGSSHSLALKTDGTVRVWGHNFYNQLSTPSDLGTVAGIGAGDSHSLALVVPTGLVITSQPQAATLPQGDPLTLTVAAKGRPGPAIQWRRNGTPLANDGRIAGATSAKLQISPTNADDNGTYDAVLTNITGSVTSEAVPVTVVSAPVFSQAPRSQVVTPGQALTLQAPAGAGATYTWSRDGLGIPGATSASLAIASVSPADAGAYVVSATNIKGTTKTLFHVRVAQAGQLWAWGANGAGESSVPTTEIINLADLSAGYAHTLALKSDGTVLAWGRNDKGQCTIPGGLAGVVQVAAGGDHSVALKADGTVVAWGDNAAGQCTIPDGLANVAFVAAGGAYTVAVRTNGTVVAWGDNTYGQTNVPWDVGFVVQVSAGVSHVVAQREYFARAWGRSDQGQLGIEGYSAAFSNVLAGDGYSVGTITGNGDTLVFGQPPPAFQSSALNWVTAMSARDKNGMARFENGNIATWGRNLQGERTLPDGLGHVLLVAAGSAHDVAFVAPLPPTIVTQPASHSATLGSTTSFSVRGNAVLSYQWLKNGVPVPYTIRVSGADGPQLAITNLTADDAGDYTVRLTNSFGETVSAVAHLTVENLMVANQAGMSANSDGSLVTLSVNVAGSGPFTYQWYAGASGDTAEPVAGATGSSLTVGQTYSRDSYWVRVSNGTATVDSTAFPVGKWTMVDPVFGAAELADYAYGAGKHVVVGKAAGYSTDGAIWQRGYLPAGADLKTLAYDGARFFAGGTAGQIFTSDDGIAWTQRRAAQGAAGDETDLIDSAAGGGTTVMLTYRGGVLTSQNGVDWTPRTVIAAGHNVALRSVTYAAGRFVAVGEGYYPAGVARIYQSVDGASWQECAVSLTTSNANYVFQGLRHVVYFGGHFIAFGSSYSWSSPAYVLTSDDGLTWTTPVFTNALVNLDKVTQGAGLLVSADSRTSADGINWSEPKPGRPSTYTQTSAALGYGGGLFVSLHGPYGVNYSSIYTSPDANAWTVRVGFGVPGSVAYGNGKFVGVDDTRVATSLDGANWSFTAAPVGFNLNTVDYGNGVFLATVDDYFSNSSHYYTSSNGTDWTHRTFAAGETTWLVPVVSYLGDRWIALPYGRKILTSPDAVTWTQRFIDQDMSLVAVAQGGGRYVAVGWAGAVVVSDDGVTWSAVARPTDTNLRAIAFGAGRFVAVDGSTTIWTSTDGVYWQGQALPQKPYSGYLSTMAFVGGRFVGAYGKDVLTSSDGLNWDVTPEALPIPGTGNTFLGRFFEGNGRVWATQPQYYTSLMREPTGPGVPVISALATDVVVGLGESAVLNVAATGTGLTYQWYQGQTGDTSQPIAGAVAGSYTTAPIAGTTTYWVRVTGPGGVVNSSTVTVQTSIAPVIVTQPVDVDTTTLMATVSVAASGRPAATYQWYRGHAGDTTQPVSNATSASLTRTSLSTAERYWVRATNSAGSVDSAEAVVTPWFERTAIKNKLLGGVAGSGSRWVVSGFWADDYWSDNGTDWIKTANSIGNQSGGAMTYGNGLFISLDGDNASSLWLSTDGNTWRRIIVPGIEEGIQDLRYAGGLLFALGRYGQFATSLDGSVWTVRSTGGSEWPEDVAYGNGTFVIAAGPRTYVSTDLQTWTASETLAGNQQIRGVAFGRGVFVGVGAYNSGAIQTSTDGLHWTERATYPSNGVYAVAFDGQRFAVSASNDIFYSRDGIAWQRFSLVGTSQIAAAAGSFMAIGGSVAWQSMADPSAGPAITAQPISRAIKVGQPATLSVTASGAGLTYQWYKDGAAVPAAQGSSYNLPSYQAGDAGRYAVVVSNSDGSVTSLPALLSTLAAPQVLVQPQPMTNRQGQPAFLEVRVAGDTIAQYSWAKEGVALPGKTNARLEITSLLPSDGGTYVVTITNAAGSVTSAPAVLTVQAFPVITQQPGNVTVAIGEPASFSVGTSDSVVSYFWQRLIVGGWRTVPSDGSYTGRNTATLTLLAPTEADNGAQFRCLLVNSAGNTASQAATLTVAGAPPRPALFDAAGYLALNGDVAAAIGDVPDKFDRAWLHYYQNGIAEGRTDGDFNVAAYLAQYPALAAQFNGNLKAAALYWYTTGRKNGDRIPAGFDVLGYLARNADIAALFSNDKYGAWLHYYNYGLFEGRSFDANFIPAEYLELNTDVKAVFGPNWQAAVMHWFNYGHPIEDRMGRVPIGFNVDSYLARYPDLQAVFGGITPTAVRNVTVWHHYLAYGTLEGRSDGDFEANHYLNTNPDLVAVVGHDLQAAALHWYFYGRREGRRIPGGFNVQNYRALYPDVVLVFGDDLYGSWIHYRDNGVFEGRIYDNLFRPADYLSLNPDVAAAIGTNYRDALLHWLFYGQYEGREGKL